MGKFGSERVKVFWKIKFRVALRNFIPWLALELVHWVACQENQEQNRIPSARYTEKLMKVEIQVLITIVLAKG